MLCFINASDKSVVDRFLDFSRPGLKNTNTQGARNGEGVETADPVVKADSVEGTKGTSTINVNVSTLLVVLIGTQADFEHNAITELIFEDSEKFRPFLESTSQAEVMEQTAEDGRNFWKGGR
ncbi:MAG: hypothetical protein MMC33_004119 [Icmadophila ericetorum]|nr:hypothetical protein [Icmadophila ericetorum]